MWGAPMTVAYQVYGQSDAADDRDLQTRLQERIVPQLQQDQHPAGGDNIGRKRHSSTSTCTSMKEGESLVQFAPMREGWLIKRGTHGLKLWRRRWVVLQSRKLWYASAPPPKKDPKAHER